ncbi:glycosyltransferase family 9 protein [Pelosinus sp. UFO1]|uniref:glycosyltransferase family 9 protein n=1 Tax=Pelosinus sp. UFO1 TaxID=484770 RepID=UPI0004D1A897|nr:glycosyltransferase family 9 protein [Pelosinus sp. UFO1]AIF53735.1 glycosyl transferase family 9 [Pelosinus sp. UFO1]
MRKILIINRLGIGDVVVTTPLAKLIKDNNQAKIGFVVAAKSADLLVNHSYIDDVFAYSKKDKQKIISEIRQKEYNEAIIIDERFSSTLLAWKANCKLLNKGFEISLGASRLFQRKMRKVKAIEDFSTYIQLVNPEVTKYEINAVLGNPDKNRIEYLKEWIEQQKEISSRLVLIVPKSAALNKNWPVAYFSKINSFLNNKGIIPIYIGSKGDIEYIEQIQGKKTNAAGLFSLRELPTIAKHASFAISVCTGPMHIISTAKVPTIVLYGPSDPVRWAPPNAIVLQNKLPCVPCERLDCTQKKGQTCMELITPEQVEKIIIEQGWI